MKKTPQEVFDAEYRNNQRSPEWKTGALRGLQKAAGCALRSSSPFKSGTAQDDAYQAGLMAGLAEGKYLRQAGAL